MPKIFVIDETGKPLGEMDTKEALARAYQNGFDLVLVSPGATPPVARIMDFGKFKYEQEKQLRKQKKGSKKTEIKEVRISLRIDQHDLEVKKKKIAEFLAAGDKVKITLKLTGREMKFKARGVTALKEVAQSIPNIKIEQQPVIEGRIISMVISK